MREKVPVFCFCRSGSASNSTDDEKKRLLFFSYGLREYLIDLDQLVSVKSQAYKTTLVEEAAARIDVPSVHDLLNRRIPASVAKQKDILLSRLDT
jgi:hypothetical protein